MPLFSSSSPFDADVEKATNEKNTGDDWGLILDICDKVGRQPNGAKDCLKSIGKRMNHKVPFVVMQSLTLLDACMNNCGRAFHLEVCTRDFISQCRNLMSQKAHPKVAQRLRFFIKKWAEMPEVKGDKSLSLITATYESLKREGANFSDPDAPPPRSQAPTADVVREEEELSKAIALSLEQAEREEQAKASGLYPSTQWAHPGTSDPSRALDDKHVHFDNASGVARKVLYSVRALYDFEAAEDNELTFKSGELISVLDDSDVNWWKGYTSHGEGLFPTNFVTTDLSVDPNKSASERSSGQGPDGTTVTSVDPPLDNVIIDESRINEALLLLQNADPTGESIPDTPELLRLEAQCRAMGPLIDSELEAVDKDISQLVDLNQRVREALQMYYTLMKENPAYFAAHFPPAPAPTPYATPPPLGDPNAPQPGMYGQGGGGGAGQPMYYGPANPGGGVPPMAAPPGGAPPSPSPPAPTTQDPTTTDSKAPAAKEEKPEEKSKGSQSKGKDRKKK